MPVRLLRMHPLSCLRICNMHLNRFSNILMSKYMQYAHLNRFSLISYGNVSACPSVFSVSFMPLLFAWKKTLIPLSFYMGKGAGAIQLMV